MASSAGGAPRATRGPERAPFFFLLLLAAAAPAALAAGLPGRDVIVVTPDQEGLAGAADAASQGTVDEEQLEHRPLLRPAEVLEVIPGLVVTQHSGTGKANQYFLRGFNLDHGTDFAVHVDGMPLNLPSHGHGQGYADLNFMIPELVEHIHYRKGPYYADEGDFSAAGAAHVHIKNAFSANFADLQAGSFGYRRGLFGGSTAVGDGALLGALEVGRQDGPWENPEGLRRLNGVLRYSSGDDRNGFSVTAMGYSARWSSTDQVPVRAVDSRQLGRFGAVDPTDGGQASRHSLSAQWAKGDANSSTRASAYLVRSDLRLFSNFTYFLNDPVNGDQFEQVDRRTIAGGQASHTWHGLIAGREVEHTAGGELRDDDIPEVSLHGTVARRRLSTVRSDSVRETMKSLYYLASVTWTPWLRSIAGLRGDWLDYRVQSDNALNSGSGAASLVSPKISLVFGPWNDVEYFVNAGRGFHSNDVRGATISVDPASGAPAQRVSPLVRARGAEVGLRAAPFKGLQTSLALWRLDIDSELLFAGDAGTTEPSRPSRREGIEWGNYFKLSPAVTADFDLNLSRARFTDADPAGNHIPGAAARTASAGLTYASGRWTGGLRLRYFGPRPLIEDDSQRSGASLLVNAKAGYSITKQMRLGLEVLNLFDRQVDDITYFYESRLRSEAAGVFDKHFHPAEPRTVRVSLLLQF